MAAQELSFDKILGLPDDGDMTSPRRNAIFIFSWILFWVLMMLVAVQDFVRNNHSDAVWKPVLWEGSSALVLSGLVLAQLRATRATSHLLGRPWRWFGLQALWLPMYWIVFTPLAFGIRIGIYALVGQTYYHDPWPQVFLYESMRVSIFVGLFTAVRFGIQSYRALLDEMLRVEQANTLVRQAQLQRLTRQMQPHFLFNALNTVSSLIHSDVDQADATLIQLAEVLRATVELGDAHEAPLCTELRLARGYADVMAARFGGRVFIAWRIDESLLAERLPVMSLQPLLENVFKHTVERHRGPTRIEVTVAREGRELVLRVDDDVGTLAPAPSASETSGIGLANLRARLAALHGIRATLGVCARPSGGVRAELRLPCAS